MCVTCTKRNYSVSENRMYIAKSRFPLIKRPTKPISCVIRVSADTARQVDMVARVKRGGLRIRKKYYIY